MGWSYGPFGMIARELADPNLALITLEDDPVWTYLYEFFFQPNGEMEYGYSGLRWRRPFPGPLGDLFEPD